MPVKLKIRCAKAMVIAATLPVSDASIAVKVVPRFAPSVMGKAFSIVRMPDATMGTSIDVVTELLCTRAVKSIPISITRAAFRPKRLFRTVSVLFITSDRMIFMPKMSERNKVINAIMSMQTLANFIGRCIKSIKTPSIVLKAGSIIKDNGFVTLIPEIS